MFKRKVLGVFALYALVLPGFTFGQASPKVYEAPKEVIDKIKEEGTARSQVMKTLGYMTDVIGPRLTGSPGLKRANEWTRETLTSYGLQNARLESWGPFGRGWTLKRFTAMVDGTSSFPLIAYPKAWSPGTDTLMPKPVVDPKAKKPKTPAPPVNPSTAYTGDVVHFNAQNEAELDQYKGKLKGKIVLVGAMRELKAEFEPQGARRNEANLLDLANAPDPNAPRPATSAPNAPGGNFQQNFQFASRRFRFLHEEGAAILIDVAGKGDGGTIFVSGAQAVQPATPTPGQPPMNVRTAGATVPVQLTATPEHFNRAARMLAAGEKVSMTVDLAVEFQDQDANAYNTIAEIPGTDKSDEVVMLGGHLDSWHGGTGATDNGAGCAVMMEAVRIIQALGLKPRRTIRIALWSGEEQGLLGSRAYVRQHFGYRGDGTTPAFGGGGGGGQAALALTKLPDYDKFAAYYNIDNGTGKIRGVYMQGNEKARPLFRQWLAPFKEMGANTLSIANTGGTDHQAFDAVGLPGFQFIQDEVEYSTRTHHSNMDSFDRIQADDMKQMAMILAAFVYQTAMMEERFPRK
jgi:hypothetical protein